MKTFSFPVLLALFSLLLLGFSSCKKDSQKSRLTVYLTDAPAAYDAVNLEILGVEIKANSDPGETGWQVMPLAVSPMTCDLLEFTNGMDLLLSSMELPAGKISQLRLILSNGNTIVVNGMQEPLPLDVPSGQESGLKFNIHADLVAGIEYKLWIDFDASRSVVEDGNGGYKLKPLIRTYTEATSGAIKGVILPLEASATVKAINGLDTLNAVPDIGTGSFLIGGVPSGNWNVNIEGSNGYQDSTVNNVNVTVGSVADIGTIELHK